MARAQSMAGYVRSGDVCLPVNEEFSKDLVYEAQRFPRYRRNDVVDTLTQAINHWGAMGVLGKVVTTTTTTKTTTTTATPKPTRDGGWATKIRNRGKSRNPGSNR